MCHLRRRRRREVAAVREVASVIVIWYRQRKTKWGHVHPEQAGTILE